MPKVVSIWIGGAATVVLVVTALWAWRFAPELAARHAENPYPAKLAIRSLAIGLAAAAQVVLLAGVVGRVYPVRLSDKLFGATAAVACLAAVGVAVAIGMSAR